MLPKTGVTFSCDNAALQKLFDEAERKCLHNLKDFGADTVLVEGGGYEKIWLETQPMGGEMYWKRNMTAAMNNQLLFMRTQRADGRIAGSIQCHPDGTIEPQFNKFQGFCFPLHALNMWYLSGKEPAYLDMLADCLEKFDAYLWKRAIPTATDVLNPSASTIRGRTTPCATVTRLSTARPIRRQKMRTLCRWRRWT